MVKNKEIVIVALKELEQLSDSISCLKCFKDLSTQENVLKFILYLSLRQHILIEGSIPETFKAHCVNIQITSIQNILSHAPVRINFFYFFYLYSYVILSLFIVYNYFQDLEISIEKFKEDLMTKVSVDLLEELKGILSNDKSKFYCEGIRDILTSRYIISGFTLKPKDKRRKETSILLDVNDCSSFDLGHIRKTFGDSFGIGIELQPFINNDTIIFQNELEDNEIDDESLRVDLNSLNYSQVSSNCAAQDAVHNLLCIKNNIVELNNTVETISTSSTPLIESSDYEVNNDMDGDKDDGRSKKSLADEIYLVGDINTSILILPSFETCTTSDNTTMNTFKNTVFESFEHNQMISETFNVKLVSIFLHKSLCDSMLPQFRGSTKQALENLETSIRTDVYVESLNYYLKELGDEMVCKLKFVEFWNKCRKKPDVDEICHRLNSDFNQEIVKSTEEFFKSNELDQINAFKTVNYLNFSRYKNSLSSFLRSNVKARLRTAIQFLHGIQCYNDNAENLQSSSDEFYYRSYSPKNREFIKEIASQINREKQLESNLFNLFNAWNVGEVEEFISTTVNNDLNEGDNVQVQSSVISLSTKITRYTEGSSTRVVNYCETTAKNNSRNPKRGRNRKRKMLRIEREKIVKVRTEDRDQNYNTNIGQTLIGIIESKEYLFNDQRGTRQFLKKFQDRYLSSSTPFSMFDIKIAKSFFNCIDTSSVSSDMMNLYLEHLNFVLYLIHSQNDLPLTCVIFSSIFIEYLLESMQLISSWDAHLDFCKCKLVLIPIHLQDIDGNLSWSLVVCSLKINEENPIADVFLFLSQECIIENETITEITNAIKKWLKYKIKSNKLNIQTEVIEMKNEKNNYAVIDILTQIAFNYRRPESFDIDDNIRNHIMNTKSNDEDWMIIERRLIHVCCEPGTYNELSIFSNGKSEFFFKESIVQMMNNRSRQYQNRTLNFDDIVVTNSIVEILDESDEDEESIEVNEVVKKVNLLDEAESKFLPAELKTASLKEKLEYIKKQFSESIN